MPFFKTLALPVVLAACTAALPLTASANVANAAGAADVADSERIARLEQRLLELEQRLASQEQETKEVKTLAASSAAGAANAGQSGTTFSGNPLALDIMANSAWRNLRWTQEEQWEGVRRGISEEKVIELLGPPPRSLDSLKPRVDRVFWYETSLRDRSNALRGKISFKDGRVTAIKRPNFQAVKQAIQAR